MRASKEFEGKKLLILGGNPETTQLVQVANNMGVKTIVTSGRHTDAAKKAAWKACDVDGLDVEGLIQLAKEEKVDGVLVGVADILIPAYCAVCDALGFPCYATQKIVNVFTFKDTFKATCEKYGVHVIPEYPMTAEMKQEDIDRVVYPVMVKPVDNGGGVGMTVAWNEEDLRRGVETALANSRSKRFIVERYMQCEDMHLYYTFKDGYCSPSCISDRYTCSEQTGRSSVCLGGTYPSKHIDVYFRNAHENIVKMCSETGIRNGVLLLQAFFENENFYVYDPGFRLTGEQQQLLIKEVNGFDQREMLVRFALTGSMGDVDLRKEDDPYFRGKWGATLWILLKAGRITKVEGLEETAGDPRIIANMQRLFEGDTVPPEWVGTEKQVFTRLFLVCDSKQELADTLKHYQDTVKVYDENGNMMQLHGFDVDAALEL